ncbi:hypothetical protein SPBR_04294 [Sporothrix brasiliensis 5110]|uniref:Uncharacterized protein n=1 Tax=Sporothrix brasiliensis 5110 TaxID=1398154 RepID=A0A0C2IWU2_9PEZI|nr:uncharacterized protein SPBR_04294 [Sporothrix brasiliensis 5110]KIH93606.1 hypothetical protein SPBR_04294 [Sporothrix brasiliensis 5110]
MGEHLSSSVARPATLRQRAVNWRIPGERTPLDVAGLHVSDEFFPALNDPHLLRIARALLDAESGILAARIRAFNKTKADPDASTDAKRATLHDAEAAYAKMEQVRSGARRVGTQYLKGRHMLHFWTDQYNAWSRRLADAERRAGVKMDGHIMDMNALGDDIVQAAAASPVQLDEEVERLLEERWLRFEVFAQMAGDAVPKLHLVPTWDDIKKQISAAQGLKPPKGLRSQSTLLWLIMVTTVSNTVTFALSYNYSSHTPGAWNEADFWALIQQAITQLIGLAITIFPLFKNKHLTRWAWQAPSVVVSCLTIASIPLYLYAPTEWSSCTMLVGGAIQTFLTLQLAILGVEQ